MLNPNKENMKKVSILNLKQGDVIKFTDRLGTHTAVAMGRVENFKNRSEYSLPICFTETTDKMNLTEIGSEGYKFFRNYKSTVIKVNN